MAAERLIDRSALLVLASAYEDRGVWALELGVTGYLLDAYLEAHPLPLVPEPEAG